MSEQTEMTLKQYLSINLPDFHLARKEYRELLEQQATIDRMQAVIAAAKKVKSSHRTVNGFICGLNITGLEGLQKALEQHKDD